ncbi:MAG: 50S ribosomal protein L1 [Lentisphaerae bacterium]|jgi:large subunit ribosomal protein L1|nr:50S ribosomal protein L1 [Lentisphaerota bacterium]
MKRSKLYRARLQAFKRQDYYPLEEGIRLLKSMPTTKFDETVELAFRLGIDPRQSDQIVRGAMVLPQGTGKTQRVVVVAEGEFAQKAKDAGADEVGYEELLQRIKGGWLDFDVLIATPSAMKEVRTLGRVLGPRGLMPNPKTGTVTEDTASAVKDAKAGRIEYRCDRAGCVMMPIGKLSFSAEALLENANAVISAILRAKPSAAKGVYMQSCTLSATMSPGIRLDIKAAVKA